MRRASKRAAAPYVDARGVPLVAIDTRAKRGFAAACLITMTQRDGRDRGFLLRTAKSIDVPADVVDETRVRLSAGRRGKNEGFDDE